VHPRSIDGDRSRTDGSPSGTALPVAHHQGMAVGVALGRMILQVGGHLRLQGGEQHPPRAFAGDLVEQRAPVDLVVPRLTPSHCQHGCRLLPAGSTDATAAQAKGYAAGVTGSTIHNFGSYLILDASAGEECEPPDGY